MEESTLTKEEEDFILQCIHRILLDMGISDQLKGIVYLQDAIFEQFQQTHKIMDLYACIAEKHHMHPKSVERAIRYIIERAFDENPKQLVHLFAYDVCKPSNSEVIASVVEETRMCFLRWKIACEL